MIQFIVGILPNGNFENGPAASHLNGTIITDPNALPNWEISGYVEYIKSGQKQGDMLLLVPEGAFAVRLGNEASIKQNLNLTVGTTYSLTMSVGRTCAQKERLNVSISPEYDDFPIQTLYSSDGWDSYAWGFQAKLANAVLVVHNPGIEEDPDCGPIIDLIAIKTITRHNLLKNGNFERGPYIIPNTSFGVLIPPEIDSIHSPLPGWFVESLKAVRYIDSEHYAIPKGHRAVELLAGRESAIAQIVTTVPGKTYDLSFSVGDASNDCVGSMVLEAFADKESLKVPYESSGKGGFTRVMLRFNASGLSSRVAFYSSFYHTKVDAALCGPIVDDVMLVAVDD